MRARPFGPVRAGATGSIALTLTALTLLAGCGATNNAAHSADSAAPARPAARASATATRVASAVPAGRAGAVAAEAPRSARLPNGVTVPVRAVATRTSGVLDVPEDIRLAGWWRGGSRIGDPFGTTLLAAHVDSKTQGLGPYVALLSFHQGQQVVVRTRHLEQTFAISARHLIKQESLTGHPWIYRASGPRRLVLVTCAPPYDPVTGYQQLAVIVADPVGPAIERAS